VAHSAGHWTGKGFGLVIHEAVGVLISGQFRELDWERRPCERPRRKPTAPFITVGLAKCGGRARRGGTSDGATRIQVCGPKLLFAGVVEVAGVVWGADFDGRAREKSVRQL